jgi:parallel beta-helix repeat protein
MWRRGQLRKETAILITELMFMSLFLVAFEIKPTMAWEGTVTILADGSIDPPTAPIQRDGDTYTLTTTIYTEEYGGNGIVIERSDIILEGAGYGVRGPLYDDQGVRLAYVQNVTVRNMMVKGYVVGVYLLHCSNVSVIGNTVSGNICGIECDFTENITIAQNTVYQNIEDHNIYLGNDARSRIVNNSIGQAMNGIKLYNCTHESIYANNITTIGDSGIQLNHSNYTSTYNNIIEDSKNGIGLCYYSAHNSIFDNQVKTCNATGIRFENCSLNSILRNTIVKNTNGIFGQFSDSNVITENNITANTAEGICLNYSSSDNIVDNNMIGNQYGVRLRSTSSSLVHGNAVISNTLYGIGLDSHSSYNDIHENTIQQSYYGILIFGLCLNNTIYHNNLINNTDQANSMSSNTWDNGCEGNYWSNYNGADTDGDGVGDTNLPWEGVDNYPLMGPYWIPADINHDALVNILDVVKITSSYGATPLDPTWNPHADISKPFGKIDILDVVLCTTHYGEEFD